MPITKNADIEKVAAVDPVGILDDDGLPEGTNLPDPERVQPEPEAPAAPVKKHKH